MEGGMVWGEVKEGKKDRKDVKQGWRRSREENRRRGKQGWIEREREGERLGGRDQRSVKPCRLILRPVIWGTVFIFYPHLDTGTNPRREGELLANLTDPFPQLLLCREFKIGLGWPKKPPQGFFSDNWNTVIKSHSTCVFFFFFHARSEWLTFSEFSKFPIQPRLGVSVKSVYEKASSLSWSLWGCLSVLWQPLIFLFKPTETSQSHTLNTCTKGVMWFDVRLWAWMCNCKCVFWSIQSWPVFYSGGEWG